MTEHLQGVLQYGHQIAVKRLSKNFGQGAEEFKNRVDRQASSQESG